MENSNVTIGSNIYPCNGNPSQDPAFMAVVEEYPLLKEFADKAQFASRSLLTGKQREIIKTDMRCVYARMIHVGDMLKEKESAASALWQNARVSTAAILSLSRKNASNGALIQEKWRSMEIQRNSVATIL